MVIVSGTNGKGETAKRVESGLRALGHKTFLFTSPHLVRVEERFRFDGRKVAGAKLVDVHRRCLEVCPDAEGGAGALTPFEWLTLVGFVLAREEGATAWVLEVGLGGRLDATNCAPPRVSVVTRIAHDHTNFLGSSLESIAKEKAGILRAGAAAIIGRQASRWVKHPGAGVEGEHFALARDSAYACRYRGPRGALDLGSLPEPSYGGAPGHLAVATAAVEAFAAPSLEELAAAARAAARARWPGRFEVLREDPPLVLDGAHNPDAASWLVERLGERFPAASFELVFAARKGKDVRKMIEALSPRVKRVRVVQDRAGFLTPAEEVASALRERFAGEVVVPGAPAHEVVRSVRGPCLAAGSLFLCGELMHDLGLEARLEVLE